MLDRNSKKPILNSKIKVQKEDQAQKLGKITNLGEQQKGVLLPRRIRSERLMGSNRGEIGNKSEKETNKHQIEAEKP